MAVIFFLGVIFVSMLSDQVHSAKSFCDNICTLDPLEMYDPVCGSDGKTYAHNCAWRKSVCKSKVPVSVVHIGKCKAGGDCLKKIDCHTDKNQICASDGKPYFNECAMRKHACKDKKAKIGVQIGIKCSSCPKCEDDDHHPAVCGSDHKTYKSICHLRAAACIAKTAIIILKNGPCEVETSHTHPEKSHEKPDKKPEGGESLESWFSDQQQEDKGDARWGGRGVRLAIDNDFPRSADEAKSLKDQDIDGEEDERRSGGGYGHGFEMNRDFGRNDDARLLKDEEEDGEHDDPLRDDDN